MLTVLENIGHGVVKARVRNFWKDAHAKIAAVISAFYESPFPDNFYPHFNELSLREAMLTEVGELRELRDQIADLWSGGKVAVIIDKLHLAQTGRAKRNMQLYALALAFGYPTPSSQRLGRLIWDIKVKPVPVGRAATYSEHDREADLHTDSQYFPQPEKYFILYSVRAARCGGGVSSFLSADLVHDTLAQTAPGRRARQFLLKFDFPFSFHDPFFAPESFRGIPAVTRAKILGSLPEIRFRRDVLMEGLRIRPDLDSREVQEALRIFYRALASCDAVRYLLKDDSVALCDNHRVLHGRSAFSDRRRHLVRMRMAIQPVAMQTASFFNAHSATPNTPVKRDQGKPTP